MQGPFLPTIVQFLHDLFTVIWMGGLISLGLIVLPSVKKTLGKSSQTNVLMNSIQKRLNIFVYISIIGLWLTGFLMANRNPTFQGFLNFSNPYSAALALKHILVLAMTFIAIFRSLFMVRRTEPSNPSKEKFSFILLYLNIAVGIGVLLLSGYLTALSANP